MSTHNKSFVEYYKNHGKLYIRNYRLLAKYNNDKDSSTVCLKKEIPVGVNNKNDITYIEKESTKKKKASNGYAPRNARGNKKCMRNKSCIFEMKKYSHLEKKIFKELDYVDFLKKNKTISDKIYKTIIRKKCGLRFALPLLLILVLLVSFILDNVGGYGLTFGLFKLIVLISPAVPVSTLNTYPYLQNVTNLTNIFKEGNTSPAIATLYVLLTKSPLSWFTNSVVETKKNIKGNYCVSYLYQQLFIIIKKLKNMKKLSLGKDKMNKRKYFSVRNENFNRTNGYNNLNSINNIYLHNCLNFK
ncbi:Plasmodium exported protein (Pm-fam-a like), unknown function [Plasmodium malariae]|uniref:Fam-l protein n=1 Tax=Plasmodium malariae TaxID=5858 RepID=A0A1A8XAL4_PLAMA|nr:Plasmodium exported protein (Pm-fam-a like), unknown function [Plasmodium malariae]